MKKVQGNKRATTDPTAVDSSIVNESVVTSPQERVGAALRVSAEEGLSLLERKTILEALGLTATIDEDRKEVRNA